ncbi:MAG TPA: 50S ribosomal protein L13 [Candidatus Saccharimonadales bacterium]|nr:50S ribosomal protein L13 [Candidatus Saccharimonadales bacterium]
MKTYSAKPSDVTRDWYVLDATETPLGRLSTKAATLLTGKEKPMFTKHIDCGDYVIIINADKLVVTGDKQQQKIYYRHSGYPGGLKETSLKAKLEGGHSTDVVYHAVRGMLPVNKLRSGRLARLKIYSGEAHEHDAQKPKMISTKRSKA